MEDKEQAYKERISPLLKQLHETAKELDLPLVAFVQVGEGVSSTAYLPEWAHEDMHLACIVGEEGLGAAIYKMVSHGAMEVSAVPMPMIVKRND